MIDVIPANFDELSDADFHPVDSLRGLSVRYARDSFSFLFDQGPNSLIARTDMAILDPHEDVLSTLIDGGFFMLEECDAYRKTFDQMVPNPFEKTVPRQDYPEITVARLPDCDIVFKDSGYKPIPAWRNSFFKITPFAFSQAFVADDTFIVSTSSRVIHPVKITQPVESHLVCPRNSKKIRCCATCPEDKKDKACKFKILGLHCCKLSRKVIEAVRDTVMNEHMMAAAYTLAFIDYTNILRPGAI